MLATRLRFAESNRRGGSRERPGDNPKGITMTDEMLETQEKLYLWVLLARAKHGEFGAVGTLVVLLSVFTDEAQRELREHIDSRFDHIERQIKELRKDMSQEFDAMKASADALMVLCEKAIALLSDHPDYAGLKAEFDAEAAKLSGVIPPDNPPA
jgi:hypothetical protein